MEQLIKKIEEILQSFDAAVVENGDKPATDSQSEKELSSYPEKPRITEAYTFAKLNLLAGREQLASMPDLIRKESLFMTPVAARAVLEASASALWMLNPAIDAKERVTRAIILLCDGKSQLMKFHNDDKSDKDKDAKIAGIKDFFDTRLPAILAANGISYENKAGDPIPPQDKKPKIIDMIEKNLNQDFRLAYRILSGFAHGQQNILMTFGYDISNPVKKDGMNILENKPNNQIIFYSLHIAVRSYWRALEVFFGISGWDFEKMNDAFRSFYREMSKTAK